MRSVTKRATASLVWGCLLFGVLIAGVGTAGIVGVDSTSHAAAAITDDELATVNATSELRRAVDVVFADGLQDAGAAVPSARSGLSAELADADVPTVETDMAGLVRLHADDGPAELAGIHRLEAQWAEVRGVVNGGLAGAGGAARLRQAFAPLSAHVDQLIGREAIDAQDGKAQAAGAAGRTRLTIVATVAGSVLGAAGIGVLGRRRIRRAVEPEQEQSEFSDSLQFAEDEDEAHELLRRHLERSVRDSSATVLNRNNSADRLEAVTDLPAESPLVRTLTRARPRSCLAVRSGRVYHQSDAAESLLRCDVCSTCPGSTTCTPLTVSGEVIGSVLLNRAAPYRPDEEQRIRESVGQAAPVLANLRNLAIAELRAATDALTGLPNKRAVTDTTKRMIAQAQRTLSPLALVTLDLDHFKEVNDRHGHPIGDQALAAVGAALRAAIRDSDFAGRNGGEEFAVLLPDTNAGGAYEAAEKIRGAIGAIRLPGVDLTLTASLGVAVYPDHASTYERLERLADSALYLAKRNGRDQVEIATTGGAFDTDSVPGGRAAGSGDGRLDAVPPAWSGAPA
jgi:diguanylate cyclase (GGDEF)-like protein